MRNIKLFDNWCTRYCLFFHSADIEVASTDDDEEDSTGKHFKKRQISYTIVRRFIPLAATYTRNRYEHTYSHKHGYPMHSRSSKIYPHPWSIWPLTPIEDPSGPHWLVVSTFHNSTFRTSRVPCRLQTWMLTLHLVTILSDDAYYYGDNGDADDTLIYREYITLLTLKILTG